MTKFLTPFRDTRVCACGDHGFTGLTRGMVAFCDSADVPLLAGRFWCLDGSWPRRYAMRNPNGGERFAHRLICKPVDGQHVDHINGDTLDNRKKNLRSCSPQENVTSRKPHKGSSGGFKGVFKDRGRYRAKICSDYQITHLGTFRTAEEAALAYDEAALRAHGEFARTNAMLGLLPTEQTARRSDRGQG